VVWLLPRLSNSLKYRGFAAIPPGPGPAGIALAIVSGGRSSMFAAASLVILGVVGILFVRRRGARKRAEIAPAQ
jgi:hypothetical protein